VCVCVCVCVCGCVCVFVGGGGASYSLQPPGAWPAGGWRGREEGEELLESAEQSTLLAQAPLPRSLCRRRYTECQVRSEELVKSKSFNKIGFCYWTASAVATAPRRLGGGTLADSLEISGGGGAATATATGTATGYCHYCHCHCCCHGVPLSCCPLSEQVAGGGGGGANTVGGDAEAEETSRGISQQLYFDIIHSTSIYCFISY
jgi:hypothetical protein